MKPSGKCSPVWLLLCKNKMPPLQLPPAEEQQQRPRIAHAILYTVKEPVGLAHSQFSLPKQEGACVRAWYASFLSCENMFIL